MKYQLTLWAKKVNTNPANYLHITVNGFTLQSFQLIIYNIYVQYVVAFTATGASTISILGQSPAVGNFIYVDDVSLAACL